MASFDLDILLEEYLDHVKKAQKSTNVNTKSIEHTKARKLQYAINALNNYVEYCEGVKNSKLLTQKLNGE
jgi:hypothetical protein